MRRLLYRHIKGDNPRKNEVSIEDVSDRPENRITKKWICKYFVKECYHSENEDQIKAWICRQRGAGCKKNYHILKHIDDKTGENKIIYKVLGEFFVIWRKNVYKIVYINEIRIHVARFVYEKDGAGNVE